MIREQTRYLIERAIDDELQHILHHKPLFHSNHDAWAILHEEIEELEFEIDNLQSGDTWLWKDVTAENEKGVQEEKAMLLKVIKQLIAEAVQCAAVLEKFSIRKELENE